MTLEDLHAVLAHYPAITRPLAEPEALGNAGGNSGVSLWRYHSGQGPLVARAWPADGTDVAHLSQIHEWVLMAESLGFVPLPIRDRLGRTFQEQGGRLWDLSPWMPGSATTERPPERARIVAGFAALASFHQALGSHSRVGPSPGLGNRLSEIRALMLGGFDTLQAAVQAASSDAATGHALRWLELARRVTPRYLHQIKQAAAAACRLQPCLRDVRSDHLLFEGDCLTGLIDFGAMRFDVVSGDLARLLAEWVEGDRWARAEALNAYSAVRPLDDSEGGLIDAFDASAALLGAGHWVRWHFLEKRVFEDPRAVSRGIERGLERLLGHVAGEFR
ncbi:homoserine kinase type II [Singulisphaera sp. GP187]|uniref:phosphotransferase enzyme family protein n=1 Tax=Singulisphaera sp. GP187 TaxID=1882752 RepID=UPI00092A852D|nr:phosphotransferase [Singulisphaera sp. GP187]SIO62267.1 homoserine kinase type II [Singulisphaera sp. GP187]